MLRKPHLPSLFAACALFAVTLAAPTQDAPRPPAKPSSTLFVEIEGQTTSFTVDDFKSMPQKTIHVHNEQTKANENYSGVLLSDLLAASGFMPDQAHQQNLTLIAEGTDKHSATYSMVEVENSGHDADVLVATSMDGKDLGAEGQFKLIGSGDKTSQRWVRNLSAVTVKAAQ